jgi:hypothetical protein
MAAPGFAIATIKTPITSDDDLVRAINALRHNLDQRQPFLKALAEVCRDERFTPLHRRRCLLQLLALSLPDGTRLSEASSVFRTAGIPSGAAEILQGADFGVGGISEVYPSSGTEDHSLLTVDLHLPKENETCVTLVFEGTYSKDELTKALYSPDGGAVGSVRLKRVVFRPTDVVDELLLE